MRDPTYYCVQTYRRIRGRLEQAGLTHCPTASAAARAARAAGERGGGAVAFAMEGRPELGIWGDCRFLAAFGDVPEVAV